MRVTRRYNPAGGIADFWNEFRRPNPYRWPILAASLLCTGALFYYIVTEEAFIPPAPPQVTYITTFAEGRSDEEIIASNIANQKVKERRQAERAALEERKRQMYRDLGRATGIDVDAMEAEIEAERAREEAAAEAARERANAGR